MIAGAPPRSRSACSRAGSSIRPTASRENVSTLPRPIPSIESAFVALVWIRPLESTGTGGRPAMPSAPMSRPCCSPHHCRAAARAHEVRGGSAGRKRSSPLGGKREELLQPADGHRLEPRGERRADPAERVLVERGREPVCAERGGRHPARDEVEEARPRRGRRGVEPAEQLLERGDGARALLGQRPPKPAAAASAPSGSTGRSSSPASQLEACSKASREAAVVSSITSCRRGGRPRRRDPGRCNRARPALGRWTRRRRGRPGARRAAAPCPRAPR